MKRLIRKHLSSYFFIPPALLVIFCLIGYPFLLSIYLSLCEAMVGQPLRFAGLENFRYLLRSDIFLQSLKNSLVYTFSAVVLKVVFGLGLALLLNAGIRFQKFFRGAILLPWGSISSPPVRSPKPVSTRRWDTLSLLFASWRSPLL